MMKPGAEDGSKRCLKLYTLCIFGLYGLIPLTNRIAYHRMMLANKVT